MHMVQGFKTIRFKFSKTGAAKFISHLDLDRTMKSAVKRAGFEIEYSHGFNPRPKLRFSLPLSVGTESVCEFLDVNVRQEQDISSLAERLDESLSENIHILSCYEPSSDFSEIKWASYALELISPKLDEEKINAAARLFDGEVIISKRTKKTKSGFMDFNISPYVKSFDISGERGRAKATVLLSASVDNYINPDHILQAMGKYLDLPFTDCLCELYSARRVGVYTEEGKEFQ